MALSDVDDVRERTNIVDVISAYVSLKRAGNRLRGLCPFHQEKTPSFTVSPEKQLWHCFGCGAGGDVFKFIMQIEGLDFGEALRRLADRAGVVLRREAEANRGLGEREKLYQVNQRAERFYQEQLNKPIGQVARDYMKRRGLDAQTVSTFRLGYAPPGWEALTTALASKSELTQAAARVGLLVPRSQGGGHYDRFRNRLIFPIRDVQGRVLGFGGRALGEEDAKYINSPESPVFDKSRILYGIDLASRAIQRRGCAVLVEGYMDLIALHQHGFDNVVATLGTAVSAPKILRLSRHCKETVVAFDGDSAGMRAVLNSASVFEQHDLRVRVAKLPSGQDPDSCVREEGAEAFRRLIAEAIPLVQYRLDRAVAGKDFARERERREMLASVMPILAEVRSPVEREEWIGQLAQQWCQGDPRHTGRVEAALRREVNAARRQLAGREGPARGGDGTELLKQSIVSPARSRVAKAARELLAAMLQNEEVAWEAVRKVPPGMWPEGEERELARRMERALEQEGRLDVASLAAEVGDPRLQSLISALGVSEASAVESPKVLADLIECLRKDAETQEFRLLAREIERLSKTGDSVPPEIHERVRELAERRRGSMAVGA